MQTETASTETRTLADLPEYLRARVPVGLLAMEPEALIALMCDVVHDTLYAVDALAWDRDNLAAMVASLRAGDLDLGRAIARYDLRVGVSALVYRLLTIARDIRTEPTAATYAHAWLALRTECASTALFYTKLSRGSKVGRQRLSEATVAAVDRRLAEADRFGGIFMGARYGTVA